MNLSNDAEAVINRQVDVGKTSVVDVESYYEIEATAAKLRQYKRIALQFPDDLLQDAGAVVKALQQRCEAQDLQLFVLGDTSYGACCVDEVAAEHVDADCIVHYGDACLSPTTRLPVIYVFGRRDLDLDVLRDKTSHLTRVLLMCDVSYNHVKSDIISLFEDTVQEPQEDCTLLYIGEPSSTTLMSLNAKCKAMYSYDPVTATLRSENKNAQLRRRYGQVLKVRDASVIGIVVGTLGVARYLDLIASLKSLVAKSGRKAYTMAMGKLNPAKLANFAEVDAFVLVACPKTALVDADRDFYRPVVTPFELSLALSARNADGVAWTGEWLTEFDKVLRMGGDGDGKSQEKDEVEDEEKDEVVPHFSLVTGQYHTATTTNGNRTTPGVLETGKDDDLALATQSQHSALSKQVFTSPALDHLRTRQWRGLGSDDLNDQAEDGNADAAVLAQGRRGIARDYDTGG